MSSVSTARSDQRRRESLIPGPRPPHTSEREDNGHLGRSTSDAVASTARDTTELGVRRGDGRERHRARSAVALLLVAGAVAIGALTATAPDRTARAEDRLVTRENRVANAVEQWPWRSAPTIGDVARAAGSLAHVADSRRADSDNPEVGLALSVREATVGWSWREPLALRPARSGPGCVLVRSIGTTVVALPRTQGSERCSGSRALQLDTPALETAEADTLSQLLAAGLGGRQRTSLDPYSGLNELVLPWWVVGTDAASGDAGIAWVGGTTHGWCALAWRDRYGHMHAWSRPVAQAPCSAEEALTDGPRVFKLPTG